ncbi:MAG: ribbon-helix-helix domain-containing protein [Anaplasmataceae bacterium]|nr:ribbon-helix-helix domain-containing protein [Anaplasmataceae bacterium]
MADQIVSVRMPVTLVTELKHLAERNHYLDISEEIRSLIREKWSENNDPYSQKLLAIQKNITRATIPDKVKTLRTDLKKLLEELNELS